MFIVKVVSKPIEFFIVDEDGDTLDRSSAGTFTTREEAERMIKAREDNFVTLFGMDVKALREREDVFVEEVKDA